MGVRLASGATARGVGVLVRTPRLTVLAGVGLLVLAGTIALLSAILGEHIGPMALLVVLMAVVSVATFFDAAVVHAALCAFRGQPVRVFGSIAAAGARMGALVRYSAVVAVVTLAFVHLAGEDPGRLTIRLATWSWLIANFFVVPVIMAEGRSALGAFTASLVLVSRGFGAIILVELARRALSIGLLIALHWILQSGWLPEPLAAVAIFATLATLVALSSALTASLYRSVTG